MNQCWRSGFAVGLSAISLLATSPPRSLIPVSRPQFPFPSPFPFPFPVPVPRSQFPFPSPHGSQRMPLQSLTLSSLQAYKSTSQRVKKKYPFRSLRQRRIGRSEWKEEVHESHLVPFRVISRT